MRSVNGRLISMLAVVIVASAALPCAALRAMERKPLAVVEARIITRSDVETRINAELMQAEFALAGEALAAERRRILDKGISGWLDTIIEEKLLLLEGRRLTEEEQRIKDVIEAEVNRIWKRHADMVGGEAQLRAQIMRRGLTPEKERERMRESLYARMVLDRYIEIPVEVSPGEIRSYYWEHRDSYRTPRRVEFRQIFLPWKDFESRERARERAEYIRRNISPTDDDFAESVERFSKGPRAAEGGAWRLEEWDVDAPDIRQKIAGMRSGDISDPLEGPDGMYIIMATRVARERVRPLRDVQDEIRALLIEHKRAHRRKELLNRLRRRYHVEVF